MDCASAMGPLMGDLPEHVIFDLFVQLAHFDRPSALALAFTSKAHLRVFRLSQTVLALPDALPHVARAIAFVLPALHPATHTLVLSRHALDSSVADLWASIPPLPSIRTLHIPALRRSPLFQIQTRTTPPTSSLLPILSRLPGITTLSLSLAAPGPDPAVAFLPALLSIPPTSPCRLLPSLRALAVTSTGPYLHVEAQQILPPLLRAMSSTLAEFSVVLPPRIIPTDFVAEVIEILARAPQLQEAHLTLPNYNFLSTQNGYAPTPHLKSLTLGDLSLSQGPTGLILASETHGQCVPQQLQQLDSNVLGSPTALNFPCGPVLTSPYSGLDGPSSTNSRHFSALLAHLPHWNSLQVLTIHSATPMSLDILFGALDHRLFSATVAKRPRKPQFSADWLCNTPWRYASVGIDRDSVAQIFCRRFGENTIMSRTSRICPVPVLNIDSASQFPRQNYLTIRLLVGTSPT